MVIAIILGTIYNSINFSVLSQSKAKFKEFEPRLKYDGFHLNFLSSKMFLKIHEKCLIKFYCRHLCSLREKYINSLSLFQVFILLSLIAFHISKLINSRNNNIYIIMIIVIAINQSSLSFSKFINVHNVYNNVI